MEELKILERVNGFIFIIAMAGAVLSLIYLGIKYFTASGEIAKIQKFIGYVIIGLILLIIAGTVPTLILSFLKGKV
ncbi:MAG: hypothetical protein AAB371_02140 [Patescibacteria group bacterium]